jgi:hypothetical protein
MYNLCVTAEGAVVCSVRVSDRYKSALISPAYKGSREREIKSGGRSTRPTFLGPRRFCAWILSSA